MSSKVERYAMNANHTLIGKKYSLPATMVANAISSEHHQRIGIDFSGSTSQMMGRGTPVLNKREYASNMDLYLMQTMSVA
jgi:hypothetical protein